MSTPLSRSLQEQKTLIQGQDDHAGAADLINETLREDVRDNGYVSYFCYVVPTWQSLHIKIFGISIYTLKGYPYTTSPKEEGTHRRLLYYDGKADLDALMAEHVRERKGKMLVTGMNLPCKRSVNASH